MDTAFLTSAFRASQYPVPDRPEIAFAGKSNVGKSSLINVLVNRKNMARTSSRPGRTQSINFFRAGNDLYLVDLPGYGFARVPIKVKKSWQNLVETYLRERSNLSAVVLILDIRRDASNGDIDLMGWLRHYQIPTIPVLTKIDKISRQQARTRANLISRQFSEDFHFSATLFSAKTRQGMEEIWERIDEAIKA
ncbi:MAG: ribosome biogenesis GTP-binding protein YihA/YsxC [Desulfatiglans sp.]|jgi:GTP-binding protein|nr:ribosome biogenesis GTP-binding protein YihA/YsxC [Thermodesulfobacteriota bacterium]MEE4351615.1 ribosome biogenesis GTP-binding protein YihA/YsxC [Desulfatiglans sp.]